MFYVSTRVQEQLATMCEHPVCLALGLASLLVFI